MQILISWSRIPSKSRFRSFVKILFWVENPLLWRGICDGQNSCCICHNTKGWKHICVLRKQAGNKLFTVHSSVLTLYFDFDFGGSTRRRRVETCTWKKRPKRSTCVQINELASGDAKKPSVGKTLQLQATQIQTGFFWCCRMRYT